MSPVAIRPVVLKDYADIARVQTAVGPEPVDESAMREWGEYACSDEQCPGKWFVAVEQDGSLYGEFRGWGYAGMAHWLATDEREVYAAVLPGHRGRGVGSFLLKHAETLAGRDGPKALFAHVKGYDHASIKWMRNRGYEVYKERTESVLDLGKLDPEALAGGLERVRETGTEIVTVWDENIEPYLHGLYLVDTETSRDLPFRSKNTPDQTYESWLRAIKECACRKVYAIALVKGEVVGFSDLWMPRMEGQSAAISYTGVLKEHRGKGIALALKVTAAAEGKKAGAKTIRTQNDPDNPGILHLNEKMGFQRVPGPVIFRKSMIG